MRYLRLARFCAKVINGRAQKLTVSVTARCNFRCKTCRIWGQSAVGGRKSAPEPSLSDYENFFHRHRQWNWISLTGGEPFLRDDLGEIAEAAIGNCRGLHTLSIPTNGYFSERIVNTIHEILAVKEIPSVYLTVSLDGPERVHDDIRRTKGAYRKAVKTYRLLQEIHDSRLKVHYEYTLSRFNQGRLRELVEGPGFSRQQFIITIAQNSPFYNNLSFDCTPDPRLLQQDLRDFLGGYSLRSLHDVGQWVFLQHVLKHRRIPCTAGRNTYFLDPCGRIYPCITIRDQIGSMKEGIAGVYRPPPGCSCYTPCESYFNLLMGGVSSLTTLMMP